MESEKTWAFDKKNDKPTGEGGFETLLKDRE